MGLARGKGIHRRAGTVHRKQRGDARSALLDMVGVLGALRGAAAEAALSAEAGDKACN